MSQIVEQLTVVAMEGIRFDLKSIIEIAADIPHISIDRIRIQQVLQNLI